MIIPTSPINQYSAHKNFGSKIRSISSMNSTNIQQLRKQQKTSNKDNNSQTLQLNKCENTFSNEYEFIQSPSPPPVNELPWFPAINYNLITFIYVLLSDPTSSFLAFIISITITLLIVLSCISFILESMPQYRVLDICTFFLKLHLKLNSFQMLEKVNMILFHYSRNLKE